MLTLVPKGVQTKLLKFFCLKVFSICHRCRWHRWQTLSCIYLREFSKNSKRPNWFNQRLGGIWFKKKTRSKTSRDTVPLKCGIINFSLMRIRLEELARCCFAGIYYILAYNSVFAGWRLWNTKRQETIAWDAAFVVNEAQSSDWRLIRTPSVYIF